MEAVQDVQLSVDEINEKDFSNVKEVEFPPTGKYGVNILDKSIIRCKIETVSMAAILPKNEVIKVKVSGVNWGFPAFQPQPGWDYSDAQRVKGRVIRTFTTVKFGYVDLKFYLTGSDEIDIEVYENEEKEPSWKKSIHVE